MNNDHSRSIGRPDKELNWESKMQNEVQDVTQVVSNKGFTGKQVLLIVFVTLLLAILGTYFILQRYVFINEFKPVTLSPTETQALNQKLQAIGYQPDTSATKHIEDTNSSKDDEVDVSDYDKEELDVQPEAYREDASKREIILSEKELNAMLAHNTNLAKRVAIDLSSDLASAKILLPMEEDFPMIGGKTLRINTGLELSFADDKPVVILKGVSIMGVPIPNAWLGNMKNVDLVKEFGVDDGFWKTFAAGVEYVNVQDGKLQIKLKE